MKRLQLYISIGFGLCAAIGLVAANLVIGHWWLDNVITCAMIAAFASNGAINIYKSLGA